MKRGLIGICQSERSKAYPIFTTVLPVRQQKCTATKMHDNPSSNFLDISRE